MSQKTLWKVFFCVCFLAQGVQGQTHATAPSPSARRCVAEVSAMGGQTHGETEVEIRTNLKCFARISMFADYLQVGKHSGLDGGLKFEILHRTWLEVDALVGLDRLGKTKAFIGAEAKAKFRGWHAGATGILSGRFGRALELEVLKLLGDNVGFGPGLRITPEGTQILAKVTFSIK